MQHLTAEEAKNQLPDLIDAAAKGDEVVIRNNGSVVKLVPVPEPERRPRFGSAKGLFTMSDDFDEPLEDFKEYM